MILIERIDSDGPAFASVRRIRREVFVEEQGVSPENEFDIVDTAAVHFLASVDGHALGTARLYCENGIGRIGRVAVLREGRGRGVGSALMAAAVKAAGESGFREILLHAQVRVRGFYERAGFQAEGEDYIEEGIPHVSMRQVLFPGGRG